MTKVNEKSRTYFPDHERCRTYRFPNDEEISVFDVIELRVSKTGGHWLTTKSGTRNGITVYIPYKWLAIRIHSSKDWDKVITDKEIQDRMSEYRRKSGQVPNYICCSEDTKEEIEEIYRSAYHIASHNLTNKCYGLQFKINSAITGFELV